MGKSSRRNSLSSSNGSVNNGSNTHSDMSSSGSSYGGSSSESDSEKLRRHMKLYDESVLYSEEIVKFKSGSSSNLRYNVFGIGKTSIFFYGAFSLKKKRKIIPFKSISAIEWLEDDSIKLTVPIENKDKPKTYNIHFKSTHKGSPYRLIESRWQASKIPSSTKLSTGEELYRNPSTPNLLRHFQNIPRDEKLEFSYRCRIKGSQQNYGVLFVTQTRILFLSIDTTFKAEEIKFEKVLEITESLPGKKGKLKKSILVTIGKNQSYSFSSFENKDETLQQLTRSLDSYKKSIIQQQQKSISKPINNNSTTAVNSSNNTTTTTTTTQPTQPTVYAPETPLPNNSKTTTWTSTKATPTTTSPLTPSPTTQKPNNITPAPSGIRPPTTPLLPERKQENYGDRANKVFPKETATEIKQKEEIKQKNTNKANRNCCSLW